MSTPRVLIATTEVISELPNVGASEPDWPQCPIRRVARILEARIACANSFAAPVAVRGEDPILRLGKGPKVLAGKRAAPSGVAGFADAIQRAAEDFDMVLCFGAALGNRLARRAKSPLAVVLDPDDPVRDVAGFAIARPELASCRLVASSPLQHLHAIERLRFPADSVELIPPAVDHKFFSPSPRERQPDVVVVPAFRGIDWNLVSAVAAGLGARVEILVSPDDPVSVPARAISGAVVREGGPADRREAFRRAAVVAIPSAERDTSAGWQPLLEAMSCAAPIVAVRTWGLEHLMFPESEGAFVPLGDSGEFRNASRLLLCDPTRAESFGRTARCKVEDSLTLAHFASRLQRIVRSRRPGAAEFHIIPSHARAEMEVVA